MKEGCADVEQFVGSRLEVEDYEVKKIQQAVRNLLMENKNLKEKGNDVKKVRFVTSETANSNGHSNYFVLNINKDGEIISDLLEKEVGRKVIGIKFRQGRGKGWRFLKVEEGLINPPACGWSERDYLVITQDDEEVSHGHLGQGCISTPGHSRRQDSNVKEGPMFPPHLGGPRISTM